MKEEKDEVGWGGGGSAEGAAVRLASSRLVEARHRGNRGEPKYPRLLLSTSKPPRVMNCFEADPPAAVAGPGPTLVTSNGCCASRRRKLRGRLPFKWMFWQRVALISLCTPLYVYIYIRHTFYEVTRTVLWLALLPPHPLLRRHSRGSICYREEDDEHHFLCIQVHTQARFHITCAQRKHSLPLFSPNYTSF